VSYVFPDGTPVPHQLDVVPQAGTNKLLVFSDHRWLEVRRVENGLTPQNHLATVPPPGAPTPHPSSDDLLAGVRTGRWLDEQVFDPLEYAVEGIVPEGLTVLVGLRKSVSRGWCWIGPWP
jgi:hypothetical protein